MWLTEPLLEQPQSKETFINDIQKVSREDIVFCTKRHLGAESMC